MTTKGFGSLKCYHCELDPKVLRRCEAIALYVLTSTGMSRLFVHRGTHYHPVGEGIRRSSLKNTRIMVQKFLSMLPTLGARHIQMNLAKDIGLQSVACEHQNQQNIKIGPNQLGALFDELEPLVMTKRYSLCNIQIH